MKYLITGATGFVGTALCTRLLAAGHQLTVLSRRPQVAAATFDCAVNVITSFAELADTDEFDVVINLAGEAIADQRWSDSRKQQLRESRIALTTALVNYLRRCQHRPELLISASAVGFYGDQGGQVLTELSASHADFAHELCRDWEQQALLAAELGIRVCILRIGLVLAQGGGILQKMALPFRLGLGGPMGSGKQWMSWIHRDDLLAMIDYLIVHRELQGIFNATAPEPVTNLEFSRQLARCYHRPAFCRVPAWLLRLGFGEMATLLLGGQRALPQRIQQSGFTFQFNKLSEALQQACRQ